jgi:hypothetical protein
MPPSPDVDHHHHIHLLVLGGATGHTNVHLFQRGRVAAIRAIIGDVDCDIWSLQVPHAIGNAFGNELIFVGRSCLEQYWMQHIRSHALC